MKEEEGPSLVVQWLALHAPSAGGPGSIRIEQGIRAYRLQPRPSTVKKINKYVF